MIRRAVFSVLLTLIAVAGSGCAAPGSEVAKVTSTALGRDMPIEVYRPSATAQCSDAALLVLFHGRGGDASQWMGGNPLSPGVGVDALAARLIADGTIRPVTIVSAAIDDSYGVDSAPADDGYAHGSYRRYITDELLPQVIRDYGSGDNTAVYLGGLSMGGYVALDVALDNPGRFAGVGALSPAFFVSPPADRAWMYSTGGRPSILERADAGAGDGLPMFVGVGTNDYPWIRAAATRFAADLSARGMPLEMQTVDGGHEVATWRALAEPLLRTLFPASDC